MDGLRRNYLNVWLFVLFAVSGLASAQIPDTPLIAAARTQDWDTLQSLLKTDRAVINTSEPDGTTALAWTVYWDHLESIKLLLAAGADPNLTNDNGVGPLILAIQNRSDAAVKTLLESGADPNAALWDGVTPLMVAARIGTPDVIETLLAYEADVNSGEPRRGQTALMWAISFEQPTAAKILIENGADISARSRMLEEEGLSPMFIEGYNAAPVAVTPEGGYTPLMFAARAGDLETTRLLVERGANVNVIHKAEATALVIAASEGHEDLALYLLEHGAEVNHADDSGMTALHYAMRDGLKILHGVSITNATQICGLGGDQVRLQCKPLDQATEEELAAMEGPNSRLFVVEDAGIEPLRGRNMHKLAEALLTRGADVNARMQGPPPRFRVYPSENSRFSTKGATPFFLAAAVMDVAAVDMLLKHGADPMLGTEIDDRLFAMQVADFNPENRINTSVSDNQIIGTATPLMAAVGLGRYNELYPEEEEQGRYIAEKLLSLGADINATTVTGWTALHGAAYAGANNLVAYLVEKGAKLDVQNGCGMTPLDLVKGEKGLGLIDAPKLKKSTAELLIKLGANTDLPLEPVGECILGTGGRETKELDLLKKIREMRKAKSDLTTSR